MSKKEKQTGGKNKKSKQESRFHGEKLFLISDGVRYSCKEIPPERKLIEFGDQDDGFGYDNRGILDYGDGKKPSKPRYIFDADCERTAAYTDTSRAKFDVQFPEKLFGEYVKDKHIILSFLFTSDSYDRFNSLNADVHGLLIHDDIPDDVIINDGHIKIDYIDDGKYYVPMRNCKGILALDSGSGIGQKTLEYIFDNESAIKRIITHYKPTKTAVDSGMLYTRLESNLINYLICIAGIVATIPNETLKEIDGVGDSIIEVLKKFDVRKCLMGDIATFNCMAGVLDNDKRYPWMYYCNRYSSSNVRYHLGVTTLDGDWSQPAYIVTNPLSFDKFLDEYDDDSIYELIQPFMESDIIGKKISNIIYSSNRNWYPQTTDYFSK